MKTHTNYALEEYKMLKDEIKSYTDSSFRDFQLFITIFAIFVSLFVALNKSDGKYFLPEFVGYAMMQLSVFVFLLIQFNRISYMLIVRKHLANLEETLNKFQQKMFEDESLSFQWESKIVPQKIAILKSSSSLSQIVIGAVYILIFILLCLLSISKLDDFSNQEIQFSLFFEIFYLSIITLEFICVVLSLLAIQRRKPFVKK